MEILWLPTLNKHSLKELRIMNKDLFVNSQNKPYFSLKRATLKLKQVYTINFTCHLEMQNFELRKEIRQLQVIQAQLTNTLIQENKKILRFFLDLLKDKQNFHHMKYIKFFTANNDYLFNNIELKLILIRRYYFLYYNDILI